MNAPSAGNAQPWQFIVITDRKLLDEIAVIHPHAKMTKQAPLAILVCGDTGREIHQGFWPIDCSAAVQNILLAAHGLGLGAVWTGIFPRKDRADAFRQMFHLPEHIAAHSLIPIGYPADFPAPESRYRDQFVHHNRW